MAPSPTGYFHVGSARTALFNFVYARQSSGTFVLRIEDTDTKRNKPEFENDITEQMEWLELTADEKYRQSELIDTHNKAIKNLIDSNRAYISKEPSKEDDTKEVSVVRLRNKGEVVTFNDLIRGEISFDTTELGDFVVARSLEDPLYHLAAVVDDNEMNITHVIRGEDHISNTPRQILIQRALGYTEPTYAHLPLILAPDKSKLSKRKHTFAIVKQLREDGFDSKAIVNFLMLLGWSPGDDREIFSIEEIISEFQINKVNKSGAIFNIEKLRWLNREYILNMEASVFSDMAIRKLEKASIQNFSREIGIRLIPQIKERISVWSDIDEMSRGGEFDYFFSPPKIETNLITWKDEPKQETVKHLKNILEIISEAEENTFKSPENVKSVIWDYANQNGRGAVLWPLRYALSGKEKSIDPFSIIHILGKEEAIMRIKKSIEYVS